jgi:hydrogenase expression/formation protein HypE
MSRDANMADLVGGGEATALTASCPRPISNYERVVLAHGSGGKLSQRLMQQVVLPQFTNDLLAPLHDGAIFTVGGTRLAFSTDSYVVKPLFFPGGDIGKLAVHGTVNDLAMCGARPLYLSAGFILEEGHRPIDARSRRRRGCSTRHGRHEGGRSRQSRRNLH